MTALRTIARQRSELLAALPAGRLEEILVRADRAVLTQSVARGVTHTLANVLQVLSFRKSSSLPRSPGDLGLTAARRVLLGVARPGESIVGPVILGDVLAEVEDWQRCQTGLPPVPVRVTVAPGLAAARVCATHLRHALLDLVTNAKEAVAGRRDAEIRLEASTDDGGLVVTAEDDGPGIAAGDLQRVFAPFYTTKDADLHLGVGLTVARLLLERNGGSVKAEARDGTTGARFVVRLPRWGETARGR